MLEHMRWLHKEISLHSFSLYPYYLFVFFFHIIVLLFAAAMIKFPPGRSKTFSFNFADRRRPGLGHRLAAETYANLTTLSMFSGKFPATHLNMNYVPLVLYNEYATT